MILLGLCNVVVVVVQNAKHYALQDLKLKSQLYVTKEIYFTEVFLITKNNYIAFIIKKQLKIRISI